MPSLTQDEMIHFVHEQSAAWNNGDRDKFFKLYQSVASKSLTIDYVGQPAREAWPVLEGMWASQNGKVRAEKIGLIANGNEVACYIHNHVIGTEKIIETIEIYVFGEDSLVVRYFIGN